MIKTLVSKLLPRPRLAPSQTQDGGSQNPCTPDVLTIEVDRDGSPVSKRASEWLVCFVPGLQKQWWHRFTHPKHKHVFALKMVSEDQWVIFEPWWNRIMVTTLAVDEAVKFLRWGAAGSILKVRERIPGKGSQARGWANCAVQISLMLGRPYWTWTPHGLYTRLSVEDGVEAVDLAEFLEQNVLLLTQRIAGKGLGDVSALTKLSPKAGLIKLGERLSNIMFSPGYRSLYRFAVSEGQRFPAAAAAFFKHGPTQVEARVKAFVSHFCDTGRFRACDPEKFARTFLSMLRGNLYLEFVLGCKLEPEERDLTSRTRAVVEVLFRKLEVRPSGTSQNRQRELRGTSNRNNRLRPLAQIEGMGKFATNASRTDACQELT